MTAQRDALEAVLVAHQRRDSGSCLCGWSDLGLSHPGHQADAILAQWDLTVRPQLPPVQVFYDRTRHLWCVEFDGRLDRQAHFPTEGMARTYAVSVGWTP